MEIKDVIGGVSRKFKTIGEETLRQKCTYILSTFKVTGVSQDGNFTSVILSDGVSVYVGTAKRNPTDKNNPKRGKLLALSRAVRSALTDQTSENQISHLVVI